MNLAAVVCTFHTTTSVLTPPSLSKSFLAVRAERFSVYASKALGEIHDCHIAEGANDLKSVYCFGFNGPWASLLPEIIQVVSGQNLFYLQCLQITPPSNTVIVCLAL